VKITVFTSNQPRHISLIEDLSRIAQQVYAIQECNTVFPGKVEDFFRKSEVMQKYFHRVVAAERAIFGKPRFVRGTVSQLVIKSGDLNLLDLEELSPALSSDVYVVFGASFIKGPLCEFLVERQTLNIHMGVSPYYRGSSTNFWPLYDKRPEYVGATIHLLTKGLDSGPVLFHAFPKAEAVDPFLLGMRAAKAAHLGLVERIRSGEIRNLEPVLQDKNLELRYTRNADFTDSVASEYLNRLPRPEEIQMALERRNMTKFANPLVI
jgi:hypothetical protein